MKMIVCWIFYIVLSAVCLTNKFVTGFDKDITNEEWIGTSCCEFTQNPLCRSSCYKMKSNSSLHELQLICRPSDELKFTSCLENRQEAERCCSGVLNSTCRSICNELFQKPPKHKTIKLYSSKGCFHQIPKCLINHANFNSNEANITEYPIHHLYCCEKAPNPICMQTCQKLLDDYSRTTNEIHDILDSLEAVCDSPIKPQQPMWSCFMQSAVYSSDSKSLSRLPLDVAKLSCCNKAVQSSCQKLCWRAFQSDWSLAVNELETECLNSNVEGELRRCLDDAANSCELGCEKLSYCSDFNDKPTNLFRSCSSAADKAANWEADNWARGGVIRGLGILLQVAPTCPTNTLRAAACLLQLRPCEYQLHESRLCREDCLEIMNTCVDWSNIHSNLSNSGYINESHSANSICAKLSPAKSEAPCISIKSFIRSDVSQNREDLFSITNMYVPQAHDSQVQSNIATDEVQQVEISTPCRNDGNKNKPCPEGFICVRRNGDLQGYNCVKACALGEMSKQLIPVGSWIQLPRMEQRSCHKICQCTSKGFEKCKTLKCINLDVCWINDRIITHRSYFYLDCNYCHCYESEVTCSRKTCGELRSASLPCDCPAHYVPVCSRMGITFASACLAKCAGLTTNDIEFGSCSSKNVCAKSERKENPCGKDTCIPKTRVCLTSTYKPCPQYECINTLKCLDSELNNTIICDTMNREHPSICTMIKHKAKLAYRGPCLKNCNLRGPVCGINGEIYSSECAAWANNIAIDYYGQCIAVGLVGEEARARCGEVIACPPLSKSNCIGVTPPGACCPVCAGAARLYYSRKQLERIYHIMDEQADKDVATLETMINALNRQIQVSQCNLRGMISPEGDIFIMNQVITKNPTELQLQICVTEIEKLVTRINEKSPTIVTELPLSTLTGADIAHSYIFSHIMSNHSYPAFIFIFAFISIIFIN